MEIAATSVRCPLLDEENRCLLYDARPITCRLYGVPKARIMRRYVLPGILPYWLASFSAVLASGWKAAAVAEFLGSHDGVGAKIFWSYRNLAMEELNAWALALIVLGVGLYFTPDDTARTHKE